MRTLIPILLLMTQAQAAPLDPGLQALAARFWAWRTVTQPATGDDIPRVERPDGWAPDYSPKTLTTIRKAHAQFLQELQGLDKSGFSRADSVDWLCLRSAIDRVRWEVDILRLPHRNPDFYVHQTLGAVVELLLIQPPIESSRIENLLVRLESIPKTVADAQANLTEPAAPFADIALANLNDVSQNLEAMRQTLLPHVERRLHKRFQRAVQNAASALESYAQWIQTRLPAMTQAFSCGREAYEFFLRRIAYIPGSPEELIARGRQAFHRAVALEALERVRQQGVPPAAIAPNAQAQIDLEAKDEAAIRAFLEAHHILTVPETVRHYVNRRMPDYLVPLSHMAVATDFTSPTRLDEDGISYIPDPHPGLPYFHLARAQDPRPIIVHEGVPGHYFQLAVSWGHPNPIRRHFVDSGPNEGIGLYVEEMLQQFGLFDDRPHTREMIYSFMRLRALRVEVDIRLALGSFTIPQAGTYLARTVPMDRATADEEAGFFAATPGQAISYQIGKLQVLQFLADARLQQGDDFSLRAFHDYLIQNGNVPIALLRWELLGLKDEVEAFFEE